MFSILIGSISLTLQNYIGEGESRSYVNQYIKDSFSEVRDFDSYIYWNGLTLSEVQTGNYTRKKVL